MANDANLQRVEELTAYSGHLGKFLESMQHNFIAFNNVMAQKVEVLRQKKRKAEELEAQALQEYHQCFQDYANHVEDKEQRHERLSALKEAEHKKMAAQRMRSEVTQHYNMAQAMVRNMQENSKTFQNRLDNQVDQGRRFLKKAAAPLEQYKGNTQQT